MRSTASAAVKPAVPSAIDSGFADFESYAWWGVFAPAGTPKPITERFGKALIETLREPGISKQISENLQVSMLLGGPEDGKLAKERSKVLILLYPKPSAAESGPKIEEIRHLYEQKFNQESVLRADDPEPRCVTF